MLNKKKCSEVIVTYKRMMIKMALATLQGEMTSTNGINQNINSLAGFLISNNIPRELIVWLG